MSQLPQHKSAQLSDSGVHFRRIQPSPCCMAPISYTHQDDYYIFGMVEKGCGYGIVDFEERCFSTGDLFVIQPGQVHKFVKADDAEAMFLFADSSFVGNDEKAVFDNFMLLGLSSIAIDSQRRDELVKIASILERRIGSGEGRDSNAVVRRLVESFAGIVAEAMQEVCLQQTRCSHRQVEIVLSFRRLLAENLASMSRRPSAYASMLNISTVYLNEVVKEVTGVSVGQYIKNEMVLQAKRLLVHTDLSVKEVSCRLGIEDPAYFSRLFTSVTGMSPTAFRNR